MVKEAILATKVIHKGVTLVKRNRSPFWYLRVWDATKKKYHTISTKETSSIQARVVADEYMTSRYGSTSAPAVNKKMLFGYFADITLQRLELEAIQIEQQTGKKPYLVRDFKKTVFGKTWGADKFFGKKEISSITTADLIKYKEYIIAKSGEPMSSSTWNKYIVGIYKVLGVAYEERAILALPPKPKNKSNQEARASFNQEELKIVLSACDNRELKNILEFITFTFIRPTRSELFGLKVGDVKVQGDYLKINIRNGKTGQRHVISMPDAVEVFKDQIALIGDDPDTFLFLADVMDREYASDTMGRAFGSLLEKLKLKTNSDGPRTLYSMRHYSIQKRLNDSGGVVNVYALAKNAGTSVRMIEKFYAAKMEPSQQLIENMHFIKEAIDN